MATTIKGLKAALKKANQRVDKAFARYEKALLPLYMPWGHDSDNRREYASVYMECFPRGKFREYATNLTWTFFRKRGRMFYVKQHGHSKHCENCTCYRYQICPYRHGDDLVSQDCLELCKLENALDAAIDEREKILTQIEKLGVNPYVDQELWQ